MKIEHIQDEVNTSERRLSTIADILKNNLEYVDGQTVVIAKLTDSKDGSRTDLHMDITGDPKQIAFLCFALMKLDGVQDEMSKVLLSSISQKIAKTKEMATEEAKVISLGELIRRLAS